MRHIIAFVLGIVLISGCRDKIICPAFQSTYILDDSVRNIYYSYLWKIDKEERLKYLADRRPVADTSAVVAGLTPNATDYFAYVEPYVVPPNEVKKTKFGIVKYEPYWLKNYELKTAPMENVLPPPPEVEEDTVVDVGEFVASDFSDSTAAEPVIDSTAVAVEDTTAFDTTAFELPKIAQNKPPEMRTETTYLYRYDPKDKMLNVEQEYYNWYFGEQLVRMRQVPVNPVIAEAGPESNFWSKMQQFFRFTWLFNKEEGTASLDAGVKGSVETGSDAQETTDPVDPLVEEAIQEDDPDDGF